MTELRFPKLNTVILSGRLTRDVDLRYIPNGTAVAKLSLAFDRSYQKDGEWQQETSYIDVIVWSKRGEQCAENLHKGSPVIVEGYLKTRSYTDSNNQNRKATEVVSSRISFLEKTDYSAGPESTPTSNLQDNETDTSSEITNDDVPF